MKHCIIVKYEKDVTAEKKRELLPEIQDLFDNTKSIEGIHDVKLYPNVIDRENRYDLMIVIEMEKEALGDYDVCKWHHQWKQDYSKYIAGKAIFDAEDCF